MKRPGNKGDLPVIDRKAFEYAERARDLSDRAGVRKSYLIPFFRDEGPERLASMNRLFDDYCDAWGVRGERYVEPATQHAKSVGGQAEHVIDEAPRTLDFEPMPLDVLPGALQQLVCEGCAAFECDGSMIALPALCVLSTAIGNSTRIRIKPDWIEPCAFWGIVISPSGTVKSPTLDLALAPVYENERTARRDFERMMEAHHEAAQQARQEKTPAPETPTCRRYRLGDVTTEGVARVMGENPRGVLLARDELAGWFNQMDAYRKGESDLQTWIEFHGGRQTTIDRKTGDKPALFIERPFVSVTGGVQPGIYARSLSGKHAESGFQARFLVAMPPATAFGLSLASVSYETQNRYAALVYRLYELSAGPEGMPELVDVSPDAFAVLKAYADANAERMNGVPDGPVRALLGKAKMHAVRLALVLHVCERVEAGASYLDPVSMATMQRAIRLAEWFVREAVRVSEVLGMETRAQTPHDRVLDTLGETFTATEFVDAAKRVASAARSTAYEWLRTNCGGRTEKSAHGLYRDVRRTYEPALDLPGLPDFLDYSYAEREVHGGESPESPRCPVVQSSAEIGTRHELDKSAPTDYDDALNAFI